MGIVREGLEFTRGQDPHKSIGVGIESIIDKYVQASKAGYIDEVSFINEKNIDSILIYLYGKEFKKFIKKYDIGNPDIEIWADQTDSGSPIIKVRGKGVRQTTMIRGEAYFYIVVEKIMEAINSPEIKREILLDSLSIGFSKIMDKKNEEIGLEFRGWGNFNEVVFNKLWDLLG